MSGKRTKKRCFECKRPAIRLCRKCRHWTCGKADCPGSPCKGVLNAR